MHRKKKSSICLTEGKVGKSLIYFALPMIMGNMLQQCYNLVDTWMIGRFVGADALSAVGSSYALMTFLNSILIGLCMGAGAIFAYYQGKGEEQKRLNCIQTAFFMLLLLAVVISVFVEIFVTPILRLLQTPEKLMNMMHQYIIIIFLGIFFIFLYNFFSFLLRSIGESFVPLVFLGIASVINIVLDFIFIFHLRWAIQGAAWATVIAQIIAGIGLAFYTYWKYPSLRLSWKRFLQNEKPVREILSFSAMSSAQQSIMNFGILLVQGLVNSFGISVMAAFAAAVKIDTLAYMPAQEFGNAYSLFLSQNYGAGKEKRIRTGSKIAISITVLFCMMISGSVFYFAGSFMRIFVSAEETKIIQIGINYLRIEGSFYALIGILFLFYGYFRGINRPGISLVLTIVSLGTRVLLAYSFAYLHGVNGIWWSIPIGWLLADALGIWLMCHNFYIHFTED